MVSLTCSYCNKTFEKETWRYNQRVKRGQSLFYCSDECSRIVRRGRPWGEEAKANKGYSPYCFVDSPFYTFIKQLQNRPKKKRQNMDLDVTFLSDIWEKQQGRCALSNIPMELICEGSRTQNLQSASLDRINNKLGYSKGNVQFVCLGINYAKNRHSDDHFLSFLDKIVDNYKKIT
jgi:hypothetical protein